MSIGQQSGWNAIHDRCSSAFNVFVFGFENGQTTAPKMGVEICHRTGAIGRGLPSTPYYILSKCLFILFILPTGKTKLMSPPTVMPLPNGRSIVFNFHAHVLFTLTQLRGIVTHELISHGSNCLNPQCSRLHPSRSVAPTPTASGLLSPMDLKANT